MHESGGKRRPSSFWLPTHQARCTGSLCHSSRVARCVKPIDQCSLKQHPVYSNSKYWANHCGSDVLRLQISLFLLSLTSGANGGNVAGTKILS